MKEELVSFETAKLLKEKGFNEETIVGYTLEGHLEAPYYGRYFKNSDGENSIEYSAPTQSLAQKWLREKHSIHIAIMPAIIPSNEIKYYVYRGKKSWDWSELYNTYEEATEAALLYVLKNLVHGEVN